MVIIDSIHPAFRDRSSSTLIFNIAFEVTISRLLRKLYTKIHLNSLLCPVDDSGSLACAMLMK